MTQKHVGNSTEMLQAPQTATSQQDITPQLLHHPYGEQQQPYNKHTRQVHPTTDHCSRTYSTITNQEPVPPFNGTSLAPSANMTEALVQALTQVANSNKKDEVSKQMMKNIKIFDGSNKTGCITWLSQVEATARFSNTPFRELICQSMAPTMLHVFSELSALASDEDIKNAILTNYSDIPSTTEAATRLQNMQTSPTEPLVTFNHRYEAIHKVAYELPPSQQYNRTMIVEYAKKLPQNTRDKLLRKIAKKNSYIQTLDDAFKQAIEINRETSFVEAPAGRYNNQNCTKNETQINELDDSFQDCDINAMNTRSTNRSTDRSFNGSFDRSSSRNTPSTPQIILDLVTETTATLTTMTHTTGRDTIETTIETGDTNTTQDLNSKAKTIKTGTITIKIEIGSTTEDQTNTNITGTNPKHKLSSNSQIKT